MNVKDRIAGHASTSEKAIERHLRRRVASAGGLCLKYSNAAEPGYPDRLILLPGGRAAWAEIKSKGRKPSALQRSRIEQLRRMGFRADVVDSPEAADAIVRALLLDGRDKFRHTPDEV